MNYYALKTLFVKEVVRFSKVFLQTLLAPVISTLLFLIIFIHVLEGRMDVFPEVSYTQFLLVGLVMMAVIQNAFANSSSSLIQSKITGNIVFVLLTPITPFEFFLGFVAAAMLRGLLVGLGVFLGAVWFVGLPVENIFVVLLFLMLSSGTLAALGVIAGLWAEKFDQMAGFQNFIITPLSFLSGVFYSIQSLPDFWRVVSVFNPFLYMVDGFRYGFFGHADIHVAISFLVVLFFFILLSAIALKLLKNGYKLRF